MKNKGVLDSTVSTPIKWKDNCNPTITKKQKKKKGKKVKVEVKCDSFFNFFSNLSRDDDTDGGQEKDDDEAEIHRQAILNAKQMGKAGIASDHLF